MKIPKIYFLIPVWGEEYTKMFLEISLLSFLSPGNLGAFRAKPVGHKFKIYTTKEDKPLIKQSMAYQKLAEIMTVELHLIDDWVAQYRAGKLNQYDVVTLCHSQGIKDANADKAAYVPFGSDFIFADGSYANVLKIAASGKRLIVAGGYRAKSKPLFQILKEKFVLPDGTISISSRELVKHSYENIHPESEKLFWESKEFFSGGPAFLYWDVPGEGILQRGIHLQPIFINPVTRDVQLEPSLGMAIDGHDFMMKVVPDIKDIHIVTDSDEIFGVSFTGDAPGSPAGERNIFELAIWIHKHMSPLHSKFMKPKIRFHTGEISPKWDMIEEDSENVLEYLNKYINVFNDTPDFKRSMELFRIERKNWQEELDQRDAKIHEQKNALKDREDKIGERDEKIDKQHTLIRNLLLEDAYIHNLLAVELFKQNRLDEAEKKLLRAIELHPGFIDAHLNLANIYGPSRLKQAIEQLKEALKIKPKELSIWVNLIQILVNAGEKNLAMKYLPKANELESDDFQAVSALGELALKLGNHEISGQIYQRLVRLQPTHPEVLKFKNALAIAE